MKQSCFFLLIFLVIFCLLSTICQAQTSNGQSQKIQEHKAKAIRSESQDKLDEALNEWKAILDMKTIDDKIMKEALTNIAKINLKKGGSSYEDALNALKQLVRIDPNNIDARYKLGVIYFDKKLYNDAIVQFAEIVKLFPENEQAHFKLGEIYFSKKQFISALTEFSKVINKLDNNYENSILHCHRGYIYNLKDNFDQAITELKKAIEIDNSNIDAHLLLSEIYIKKGMFNEASIENNAALALDSDNKQAEENIEHIKNLRNLQGQLNDYLEKGNKLFDENKWDESIIQFQAILQLDSTNCEAKEKIKEARSQIFDFHVQRGRYYAKNKKWSKSVDEFEKSLNFALTENQFKEANDELSASKGAIIFEERVDNLEYNGISAVDRKAWEEAQRIFEAVKLLDPNRPEIEEKLSSVNNKYLYELGKKAMSNQEWGWARYCFKKVPATENNYSLAIKKIEELDLIEEFENLILQGKTAFNDKRWEVSKNYYEKAKSILENINRKDPELHLRTLESTEMNMLLNNIENEIRKSRINQIVVILLIILIILIVFYLAYKASIGSFVGLKTKIKDNKTPILIIVSLFFALAIIIFLIVKKIINIDLFLNS